MSTYRVAQFLKPTEIGLKIPIRILDELPVLLSDALLDALEFR